MTVEPQGAARVRCRQITDADLDTLATLLVKGFPRSRPAYWQAGFARWRNVPAIEGVPRYGYVLEKDGVIVGVILLISSVRNGLVVSNLSSWFVEPEFRTHSTLLISLATKLKHVTYLNASPAPHTWKTLAAQNFEPYNFGRSAVFALPGRGVVSDVIPDDLPEAQLLRDHRAMGLTSLVVERDGMVSPFVLKPRRLDKPPAPVMDVMFTRGPEDFTRCAPALAKHFMPRARMGFLIDGDQPGLSHYVEGKEPRWFKGPNRPILGDLAYTEKVVFG
jgi:hypothetical protein